MIDERSFRGSVACGDTARLGEGPTYDPATDTAYWFDILERKLYELDVSGGALTVHDLPFMASLLAVIDGERQLIASEAGLFIRERGTGALTHYLDLETDNPATRSNDGRVHPCGALWISTMGKGAEHEAGTIYHVLRGQIRRLFAHVSIPNAICFSPDGRTAYFTDTRKGQINRVSIDPETALPLSEPALFHDGEGVEGDPDGAIVDADGCLWNARWGAGMVAVFDPDGRYLRSHDIPASQATCPAFIGRNADRILVTSAHDGLGPRTRAAERLAGATFLLDATVRGRHEPAFLP